MFINFFFLYRIIVGGMIFIPQKHKGGLRVKYNSGFYIATNVYPDFGNEVDCVAIRKRLEVFQTKSLRKKDNSVSGKLYHKCANPTQGRGQLRLGLTFFFSFSMFRSAWLRNNCMQVFHFLAHALRDEPLFDAPEHRQGHDDGALYNDFDNNPMDLLRGDENRFSYSQLPANTPSSTTTTTPTNAVDRSLEEAMDHAVMVADRVEGIHYHHLTWDSEHFDNYTEVIYQSKLKTSTSLLSLRRQLENHYE